MCEIGVEGAVAAGGVGLAPVAVHLEEALLAQEGQARGVFGFAGVASLIQRPSQSPYTPVVEP